MRFGSVCSGIEAASVAWHPLGWRAAWLAEIEPFPSAVLAHHYPDVPNLGDMSHLPEQIVMGDIEAPDLFCGGTPCQAFSVAGLRQSLDDARGNLSLTFCEIANAIDIARAHDGQQPCIIFWENVPGVLSTKDNAFGCFLAGLAGEDQPLVPAGGKWPNAGCVFGPQRSVAWRVLDAQYFGVAQRRRRVFVVASARTDFDPATVLFEFEGVRRDSAPSREAGKAVAARAAAGTGVGGTNSEGQRLIAQPYAVGNTLRARMHKGINSTLDEGQTPVLAHTLGTQCSWAIAWDEELNASVEQAGTLLRGGDGGRHDGVAVAFGGDIARTLQARHDSSPCADRGMDVVATAMQVRRLTPVECERLQGFPDGYTAIPWRGKPADQCPDGPRYKALGNSWAVPVVRWIGWRIAAQVYGGFA